MDYRALVESVAPFQTAGSKQATDTDAVLFKVLVVPVEADQVGPGAPLAAQVPLPAFALVVSLNHTLGDGHTYYRLYNMLDPDAEVRALNLERVNGFEAAKIEVIGKPESAMFTSAGMGLGIVGTYLWGRLTKRPPQHLCLHTIDPQWLSAEKEKAKQEGIVPFISSNDAITSWFLRETQSNVHLMLANLRGRSPAGLALPESLAGNYEANVPYFYEDVQTPALIRQSLRAPEGSFQAHRAADPATPIPSFWTLLKSRMSIITNWAGFYRDVKLVTATDASAG